MSKKRSKTKKRKKGAGLLKDKRFKIISGLIFISCALILLLAFISYLFTWKVDQSVLWDENIHSVQKTVQNWSGKIGAKYSDFFIRRTFGLSAFLIPFVLIIIGFRFFKVRLLPLR